MGIKTIKIQLARLFCRYWRLTDEVGLETLHFRQEKPFEREHVCFDDERVNTSYEYDNKQWFHQEYVKKINLACIVEPDYSYCIVGWNRVVLSSVFYPLLKPSVPRFLKSIFLQDFEKLDEAILFDGMVGTNYFHFFSDVIGKIWLLSYIPNGNSLPLIIGEKSYNTKYFQYLLKNTELSEFNWVVQKPDEYIKVRTAYLLKPMPYDSHNFARIKQMLNLPKAESTRRVFLNRSKESGRYIENYEEIKKILDEYRFEILDTNNTTLDFQALLFDSTKYLVSIHGAGNTNIIFAQQGLRFLELNPANRIACHYYWLSKSLSIDFYNVVLGGSLPTTHVYPEPSFSIDARKFETALIKLLEE